ncbi:MAG: hypothetical protein IJC59_01130 [Lachnospiraceae bacterium]|nr:hypothetical protein [Lachnospiraceae bacterium]
MNDFLDMLVVVFAVLAVAGLAAICLMFLSKREGIRKAGFYVTVVLGIYTATVGARIGSLLLSGKTAFAVVLGCISVAAFVLERMSKGEEKKLLIARITATAALVLGMANAFM